MPEPALEPQRAAIEEHLWWLTRRWRELPEKAFLEMRALDGNPRNARVAHFNIGEQGWIEEACDWAISHNERNLSIYTVNNPVRVSGPAAARDGDVIAAVFMWADADDDTAFSNLSAYHREAVALKCTRIYRTGSKPGMRVHAYWELAEPVYDLEAWTAAMKALAARFKSDPTVVNPSRLMKVCGTVAWPTPNKRERGYVPEIVAVGANNAERVTAFEAIARAFGGDAPPMQSRDASGFNFDMGDDDKAAKFAEALEWCGTDGRKHYGVIRVTSMMAARGVEPELLRALIRHVCPVYDANTENSIRTAYKFAPDNDEEPGEEIEPVDLWGRFPPPKLPRGALPQRLERFAYIQAELMGADPGGLAAAALCVCCAAIPDDVRVKVKPNEDWRESARIWVALVGDPSTKKSPILSIAERPLKRIDMDLYRQFIRDKADYDALKKDEKADAEKPRQRRKRLEDTTIEAAQEVLADSPDGVLMVRDELGGFFGALDRYSNGKGGADRAFWLQAFNGGSYAVNRVGRGAGMIPNLSACILGGIQPEPIRKVVGDASDDGLIQRLFPIILNPATLDDEDGDDDGVRADYDALVTALTRVSIAPEASGGFAFDDGSKACLRFDDDARKVRRALAEKHLRLMAVETVNRKLAAHIGKYDGLFARLCVAFHCVENAAGGVIPTTIKAATAEMAARFLHKFLLPHAVAFYGGVLDLSDDHDRVTAIAGHILVHKLTEVKVRDVQRSARSLRKIERHDIIAVMDQMEALGWVGRMPAAKSGLAPTWIVNPAVHARFAAHRDRETARKREAHEAIKEAARQGDDG